MPKSAQLILYLKSLKKLKRINLIDENHFQNPYNYLNSLRETSPRAIFLDYKVFFLYEDVNKILLSPHVFGNNHVLPKCPHAKKLMESFPMGIESKSVHLKVKKKQIQNFYGSVNYQDLANSSFKKSLTPLCKNECQISALVAAPFYGGKDILPNGPRFPHPYITALCYACTMG